MIVPVPPRLDESGAEELLERIARLGCVPDAIDGSGVRFADPYGILVLLAIGLSAPYRGGRAWGLVLPRDPAVLSWLDRCGARRHIEKLFIVDGPAADEEDGNRRDGGRDPVLLEVALVREGADVHRAISRMKARADLLLVSRLGYSGLAADRFTVAMAEVCQNVVDHSGGPGLALAQCYLRSGGGPEIRLAVADIGIGVRASLAPRYADRLPGSWDDRAAVRLAFRRGVTGSGDPDRGLGLAAVADMVRAWGGTLRLRSGAAACEVGAHPRERGGLAAFPGTQVAIALPHANGRV